MFTFPSCLPSYRMRLTRLLPSLLQEVLTVEKFCKLLLKNKHSCSYHKLSTKFRFARGVIAAVFVCAFLGRSYFGILSTIRKYWPPYPYNLLHSVTIWRRVPDTVGCQYNGLSVIESVESAIMVDFIISPCNSIDTPMYV